jgi:hypothetical protein
MRRNQYVVPDEMGIILNRSLFGRIPVLGLDCDSGNRKVIPAGH